MMQNGHSSSQNQEPDELDKLLLGLDKLTQTLPDLAQDPPYTKRPVTPLASNRPQVQPQPQVQVQPRAVLPVRPPPAGAASDSASVLARSRENYEAGESSLRTTVAPKMEVEQPYHTRVDSKPFSYFRTNSNNASRTASRASSREPQQPQPGLESPTVLRRIMGNGGRSSEVDHNSSRPLSPSITNTSRGSSPGAPSLVQTRNVYNNSDFNNSQQHVINNYATASTATTSKSSPLIAEASARNMSDEEASLTWLQKQQRKLEERRTAQLRREGRGPPTGRVGGAGNATGGGGGYMNELKTSLERATRSDTTDGYAASETASLMFSETSTRESSPHKTSARNVPISVQVHQHHLKQGSSSEVPHASINGGLHSSNLVQQQQNHNMIRTSTPKQMMGNGHHLSSQQHQPPEFSVNLTRHISETTYDRSRPLHIQRRLRYDSEGEHSGLNGSQMTSATSNTSIDSLASGRPITPGFPNVPATPIFGQAASSSSLKRFQQPPTASSLRAPSPSANSMYHTYTASQSHASSRRGSISSEPAEVPAHQVQMAKDHHKFWYKPHISREEAIAMLKPRPPGTFVVRDSNSFPGAFGLALKVATPPLNSPAPTSNDGEELVRHFLVEPTSKGVKLKGYSNEPVFASLSALVYQHTVTPLALPIRLVLPEVDLSATSNRDSLDSRNSSSVAQMQQLLALGAACNVLYLFTMDMDSLTGPTAVKKAVSSLMLSRPKPHSTLVHFKVSSQGITLTDHARKLFFRKHYNTGNISFCGIDPDDRRWAIKKKTKNRDEELSRGSRASSVNSEASGASAAPGGMEETTHRIFAFVAKKSTKRSNQCHVFAEQDPDQPARAIVNFVNKVLLNSGKSSRSDVV